MALSPSRALAALSAVAKIPARKLDAPRIVFTVDSSEPTAQKLTPLCERFAAHSVPVTFFLSNETLAGKPNYDEARALLSWASAHSLDVEIASHGSRHVVVDGAADVDDSVARYAAEGIAVRGFRAPFLSIERRYRDVLAQTTKLAYDSSTSFERNLATSLFHVVTARKCPHRVGPVWELPISVLDDHHVLRGLRMVPPLAYWSTTARLCLARTNYLCLLFHPSIIGAELSVLDALLKDLSARYGRDSFVTCGALVDELERAYGASP